MDTKLTDKRIDNDDPAGPQFRCRVVVTESGKEVYDKPFHYLLRPDTTTADVQQAVDEFRRDVLNRYESQMSDVDVAQIT